jgi:glycosyltransferase involved in cell wall biosynthesis
MISPKITILISIYNGAETLDRCFESIQRQTFQDFEIVCINDGSTDTTKNLLGKWQTTFGERFKLIENTPGLGLTKSLNKGLELAQGNYTARIDADDWWHREKLEKQIAFLTIHPEYGLIGCNYINITQDKELPVILKTSDTEIRKSIIQRNPFAHSCVIFDTALVKSVGKYNENVRHGQDYDLWLRVLPESKLYNLPEFLCYRSIDQGISLEKQRAQMWQCMKTQVKYIKKYNFSVSNYLYLIEPLIVILSPNWVKNLKRKFLH